MVFGEFSPGHKFVFLTMYTEMYSYFLIAQCIPHANINRNYNVTNKLKFTVGFYIIKHTHIIKHQLFNFVSPAQVNKDLGYFVLLGMINNIA